ncbi:hypothetical protein SS50377_21216 [Spironucleus salmonicida]|uniref:Uncharacterized protein n=1 Tax=Spironucleus salmonicida TaxID=348837 RepID=V6LT70_9EUKA|nr:hypothetical protein SS50377_21216 [Spironucleus salmonicida]|eukprot:EST43989.1 hypothetical protein SS50377_16298 [Spironucleus salmonicida]
MLQILVNFIWWILSFIGVHHDLPPVPDAEPSNKSHTPSPNYSQNSRKSVTFSPVKDIIPNYEFQSSSIPTSSTPIKIQSEVDNIISLETSPEVRQLMNSLEELKDEVNDLRKENIRLQKEHRKLINVEKTM